MHPIRWVWPVGWVALLIAMSPPLLAADFARVAAASDLRFAMDEILVEYRAEFPDKTIEVIYGSSGRFRTQIENGAPFDLYFSADIAYPQALKEAGFAAGDVVPYALGRIVLWSSTQDASALTLEDLRSQQFRRIAIANPRHAPYGARAQEALESAGLWESVSPRLVYGENIAHAMQLVQSGASEVGIIALALALNPAVAEQGGYYLIDDSLHQPLAQGFIVTRRAADNDTAHHFAKYMVRSNVRDIMRTYGFELPDEPGS